MKNKLKCYPVVVVMCIVLAHCTGSDEYKKYMPDGEIIYPQKADSVKTYPGKNRVQLEWVITDPKVSSFKVFYELGGIQGSTTVARNVHEDYMNDTIRATISGLEEANYMFRIVSHDDFGNASLAVEATEVIYGEMYERSLMNRTVKSMDYMNGNLYFEWYAAEGTEIGVVLDYTDIRGNSRTDTISNLETSNILADINISEPMSYKTMYKPVPTAIDIFYAQTQPFRFMEILPANYTSLLNNTVAPFIMGEMVHRNRYYLAEGWIVNEEAAANGNVDNAVNRSLCLVTWGTAYPSPRIDDGKLYQTIELSAGLYRFDASVHQTSAVIGQVYVVATLGADLPDFENLDEALASALVPAGVASAAPSKPTISVVFELSEKTDVSLGFLANNISGNQEILFSKVELWKLE